MGRATGVCPPLGALVAAAGAGRGWGRECCRATGCADQRQWQWRSGAACRQEDSGERVVASLQEGAALFSEVVSNLAATTSSLQATVAMQEAQIATLRAENAALKSNVTILAAAQSPGGVSPNATTAGTTCSHTDPSMCGVFTPAAYPARVFVEAGGGGGGGGRAIGPDGVPGGVTTVYLMPNNTALMIALGGNAGRRGSMESAGRLPSSGNSTLANAVVLAGRGGAGGEPGLSIVITGGQVSGGWSATAGGNGDDVAAQVSLTAGQSIRSCVGSGGAGGAGAQTSVVDRGAAGANGFVVITVL
jgi:hypothetical protein